MTEIAKDFDLCFCPQDFKEAYVRNNKTNGQKNLRCFPACCSDGHVSNGFCGQELRVQLKISFHKADDEADYINYLESLIIVGEFSTAGGLDSKSTTVQLDFLTQLTSNFHVGKKLDMYSISSDNQTEFMVDITFDPKSWNYTWQGNRHRKDIKHVFEVSVLHPLCSLVRNGSSTSLIKLKSFVSPQFVLSCSRRTSCEKKSALRSNSSYESCLSPCPVCYLPSDDSAFEVHRPYKMRKTVHTEEQFFNYIDQIPNGDSLRTQTQTSCTADSGITSVESESDSEQQFITEYDLHYSGINKEFESLAQNSVSSELRTECRGNYTHALLPSPQSLSADATILGLDNFEDDINAISNLKMEDGIAALLNMDSQSMFCIQASPSSYNHQNSLCIPTPVRMVKKDSIESPPQNFRNTIEFFYNLMENDTELI